MTDELLIGKEGTKSFRLPLEAVTQTFGIVAVRGSGKTYCASVMAEEMLLKSAQVVILDPTDAWWGLRHGTLSHPIPIFGGNHGDISFDSSNAEAMADMIVEKNWSAVICVRHLSKRQQRLFVGDFCERLYKRKGEKNRQTPLHIFIDEADMFAPQRLFSGMEKMFGAVDDLVRRGRSCGIGVTMITQRPAAINKDVLTQIQVLIALRTLGPQDRTAILGWLERWLESKKEAQKFTKELASLGVGEAFFWSPGWLDIFTRIKIRQRQSFDSSSTPKVGKALKVGKAAQVDLKEIEKALSISAETAWQHDPKKLQAELKKKDLEIARLQKAAEKGTAAAGVPAAQVKKEIEKAVKTVNDAWKVQIEGLKKRLKEVLNEGIDLTLIPTPEPATINDSATLSHAPAFSAPSPARASRPAGALKSGKEKILTALAQQDRRLTRVQIALLTGFSKKSGTFSTYLSSLKTSGFIEEQGRGEYIITQKGWDELGEITPLPTGRDLLEHWKSQEGGKKAEILQTLYDAYPRAVPREEIGEAVGLVHSSGTFSTYLSRLKTLELVQVAGGAYQAAQIFF